MEHEKQRYEHKGEAVCLLSEQRDKAMCSMKQTSTKVRIKSSVMKEKLVNIYRHHCSTLQVSPTLEDDDLLTVYQQPTVTCVPYHQAEDQHRERKALVSHLVILWFDTRLTGLSRAALYANSMAMLLERAVRRDITFPASPAVESLSVGSPAVESLSVESPAVESLSVGSLAVESLSVGSPAVESLSVGSPAVESLSVGSPAVESLSVGSPAVESLSVGSPAVESLSVGSPAVESLSVGSPAVGLHLPVCFSKLKHYNNHTSLVYKLCLLSYQALFQQDDNVSSLVFTSDQLQVEPFHLSGDEQDLLCRVGVLSKNEVFRCSVKQKLSSIHKAI